MRGCDLHQYLAGATFVGEGWTQGTLLAVDRYPALIDGDGQVAGELYRLEDSAVSLEALDDLEDFDPANAEDSLYVRTVRDVHGKDGSLVRAWVYLYNKDTSAAPRITSGDWRQFCGVANKRT